MSKKDKKKQNQTFEEQAQTVDSPFKIYLDRYRRNKLAMAGLYITIILVAAVLGIAAFVKFSNYDLGNMQHQIKNLPPSLKYPFGTDSSGRNYFIRVFYGGLVSLQVGLVATLFATTLGVFFGGVAGYYGGRVDNLVMRFSEIVSSLPLLPLAITVQATFSQLAREQRFFIMIFFIGATGWTGLARMVRGQILSLREQEFMVAANAMGIRPREQILRHLVPNVIAHVILSAISTFAGAIMVEATLSFLGLSVQEPTPTWGRLLNLARSSTIMKDQWWLWVFPGILLVTLIIGVNLIGEGLRDAVDPKSNLKFNRSKKDSKFTIFKRKSKEAVA